MIVFFDIDGTLITEDERQYLPESTVSAIQTLRKNGHYAFVNTGRPRFNVIDKSYIRQIGFDGFVCACGSHIIFNNQDVFVKTVPEAIHDIIVNAARQFHLELMLEGPDVFYFDTTTPMCPARKKMFVRSTRLSHSADEPGKCFQKFVTWNLPDSRTSDFIAAVSPWFTYIDRGNGFSEFCMKEYSKATGIDYVASLLNQPLDHCFVIGDSANDQSMLEHVKHSILMGNGNPSLRPLVEFVTKDLCDDGIDFALRHYHLI